MSNWDQNWQPLRKSWVSTNICAHIGKVIWVLSQLCPNSLTEGRKFVVGPVNTDYLNYCSPELLGLLDLCYLFYPYYIAAVLATAVAKVIIFFFHFQWAGGLLCFVELPYSYSQLSSVSVALLHCTVQCF